MNLTADPCADFAEFACGNFYKTASYPEGRGRVLQFTKLEDKNLDVLKELISEKSLPGDYAYVNNMKNLYKSCIDNAKIDEIGIEPYLSTKYTREWPTLIGQNWSGASVFNLDKVITRYFRNFIHPFFSYDIKPDMKNSSRYMIYLDNPKLYLLREYYLRPRNDSVLMALETYLRDLAVELGADHAVAAQDAKDVVNLEIELAKEEEEEKEEEKEEEGRRRRRRREEEEDDDEDEKDDEDEEEDEEEEEKENKEEKK
ncbi:endothelin-converting enzyme 1 [Plakobranchus ocellatus]|uniref:Endothelin-converting enzyme 1 n=1 Tax=Plakobranchus ocellatus TaxID=259542 RepID=A0AAV4AI86_9GAST|nr:endothelin-converting enzyme 1 [Plakobranchus ocellatus]